MPTTAKFYLLMVFIITAMTPSLGQIVESFELNNVNKTHDSLYINYKPNPWKHKAGVSYYGASITHPGFGLIYELGYDLKNSHSINLRTTLGFSHHTRLSNTYFILPEGVYRYEFKSGFFLNALAGGGYQYVMLAGDVYEYDNGEFVKAKNPGRGYFMPSVGIGFGNNWSRGKAAPFSWFLNVRANAKYPFNELWLWFPSLETGLMYKF